VLADNEIDSDSGALKNPDKVRHKYHVGDKKRRSSIDAGMASAAALSIAAAAQGGGGAAGVGYGGDATASSVSAGYSFLRDAAPGSPARSKTIGGGGGGGGGITVGLCTLNQVDP
jgi:hypothetical protein